MSYDDIIETRTGAAEILAQELRDTGGFSSVETSKETHGYFKILKLACSNSWVSTKHYMSWRRPSKRSPVLPKAEIGNAAASLDSNIDPLWLLFCANSSNLATLQHVDLCRTKSDRELFSRLRKMYFSVRSEAILLRRLCSTLGSIHFVKVSKIRFIFQRSKD
jgi:hypothetical protein